MTESVVIPNNASLTQRLVVRGLYALLRLLRLTWRMRFSDPHGVIKTSRDKPFILCVWHNRLIFGMYAYSNNIKPISGRRLAAMVSASKDLSLIHI